MEHAALTGRRAWRIVAGCAIVVALALLAVAPLAVGDGYDWVRHTTSEAAAQGVSGAWVARLGLVLFGAGAAVAAACAPAWPRSARATHALFAAAMAATAVFPTRPWFDAPYDRTDDLLHSVASSTVGFAFVTGTALLAWHRRPRHTGLDLGAAAAATLLSALMTVAPSADGLLQRAIFVVAAAWYLREAAPWRVGRARHP